MEYDPNDIFWKKNVIFTCERCGAALPTNATITRRYSKEIETDMDYAICPNCGKDAIVLW